MPQNNELPELKTDIEIEAFKELSENLKIISEQLKTINDSLLQNGDFALSKAPDIVSVFGTISMIYEKLLKGNKKFSGFLTLLKPIGSIIAKIGFVLAPLAIGVGAVALDLGLASDAAIAATSSVEILSDSVSEVSRQDLGAISEQFDALNNAIGEIELGEIIDEDTVNEVKARTGELTQSLISELEAQKEEKLNEINLLENVLGDDSLTDDFERQRKEVEEQYAALEKDVTDHEASINTSLDTYAAERQQIRQEDLLQLQENNLNMYSSTLSSLADTEEDEQRIRTNMAHNAEVLSMQKSSAIIQAAAKERDATISTANEMFGKDSENAKKAIEKANEKYKGIYDAAVENLGDMKAYIDENNGEILSGYDLAMTQKGLMYLEDSEAQLEQLNMQTEATGEFFKNIWNNCNETISEMEQIRQEGWEKVYLDNAAGNDAIIQDNTITNDEQKVLHEENKDDLISSFEKANEGATNWLNETFDTEKWDGTVKPAKQVAETNLTTFNLSTIGMDATYTQKGSLIAKILGITGLPQYSFYVAPKTVFCADGGLLKTGQMFVAREAGPELVGAFGGNTAVMNNDQIVESVSRGVYDAVRNAMPKQTSTSQPIELVVKLDGKQITATVEKYQRERGVQLISGNLGYTY